MKKPFDAPPSAPVVAPASPSAREICDVPPSALDQFSVDQTCDALPSAFNCDTPLSISGNVSPFASRSPSVPTVRAETVEPTRSVKEISAPTEEKANSLGEVGQQVTAVDDDNKITIKLPELRQGCKVMLRLKGEAKFLLGYVRYEGKKEKRMFVVQREAKWSDDDKDFKVTFVPQRKIPFPPESH